MFGVIESRRVNNFPPGAGMGAGGIHERSTTPPINLVPSALKPIDKGHHHPFNNLHLHHAHAGSGSQGLGVSRGAGPSRLSSTAPTTTGFHTSMLKALQEDSDDDNDDDDVDLDWSGGFGFSGQMGLVTSPTHAAASQMGSISLGTPGGVDGAGGLRGFPVSATSAVAAAVVVAAATAAATAASTAPTAVAAPTTDIRVMLASGNSTPVEVLRNQVVTSLTLKLKPNWMSKNQMGGVGSLMEGMTRKLLLADSTLPEIDELETLDTKDPSEYRNLMMRLCDLQYICIKAAVDVSETGEVEEREYWLPLDKTQTVAGLKRLISGADQLEPAESPKLLENGDTETDLSMVLAGRPLEDTHTLLEEGLTHNTVVHLFVKKDANITVKICGTKDLEVKLNANETAESLRAKLDALRPKGSSGLKPTSSHTQLFYGGQELKDGPLNLYGITDGATLELKPYTSPKGVTIPVNVSRARHSWNASASCASPWRAAGTGASAGAGAGLSVNSWGVSSNSLGMNSATMSGSPGMMSSVSDTSSSRTLDSPRGTPPYKCDAYGGRALACDADVKDSPTVYGSPDLARSFDAARLGLAMGNRPQLASGGTGGAYFLRGSDGETCAVFKPADEEPCARNNPRGRNVSGPGGEGLRKGTRVGEGASREVAAYVLDHAGFAGVPATSLASLCEMRRSPSGKDLGGGKLGSLQAFVRADAEAEEMGPALFPMHEVHKITQLDIRLANTDRNAGNILVQKGEGGSVHGMKLVPIDHGYALPHTLEDVCFEWEFWPQAKLPYSDATREYIAALDVEADVQLIREQGIELQPSSERVLRVCTTLLQRAAALGCCPADIAGMMSRPMPNRMSDLEKLTSRAASQAVAAVRAQDGLVVHLSAGGKGGGEGGGAGAGRSWDDLDSNDRAEMRFMVEYEALLDSYLEGFEPDMEMEY